MKRVKEIIAELKRNVHKKISDWILYKSWMHSFVLESQKELNTTKNEIAIMTREIVRMEEELRALTTYCKTLPQVTETGFDLGLRGNHHRNWAVFCSKRDGQDYIKFVDLSEMDYNEVVRICKDLERRGSAYAGERYAFDAPRGMKHWLMHDIYGGK